MDAECGPQQTNGKKRKKSGPQASFTCGDPFHTSSGETQQYPLKLKVQKVGFVLYNKTEAGLVEITEEATRDNMLRNVWKCKEGQVWWGARYEMSRHASYQGVNLNLDYICIEGDSWEGTGMPDVQRVECV